MSKHKKRVSLAHPAEGGGPPLSRPPAAEETAAPRASNQPHQQAEIEPEMTDEVVEDAAEETDDDVQPGIESKPLFWFLLGALTVGITVLVGLLMFTPSKAAPAPKAPAAATAPALRPVTAAATTAPGGQPTPIPDIVATMTAVMERNQSVQRASLEETRSKLAAGAALVIDVRSAQSFADKHIQGAINIPELDTEARLAEFPKNKDIILYCS